jgi:hypothetical protein
MGVGIWLLGVVTVTTTAMFIRHMRVEKAASVAKVPASQISRSANPITGVFSPARMAAADRSPIMWTNTIIHPATKPGRANGRIMRVTVRPSPAPAT